MLYRQASEAGHQLAAASLQELEKDRRNIAATAGRADGHGRATSLGGGGDAQTRVTGRLDLTAGGKSLRQSVSAPDLARGRWKSVETEAVGSSASASDWPLLAAASGWISSSALTGPWPPAWATPAGQPASPGDAAPAADDGDEGCGGDGMTRCSLGGDGDGRPSPWLAVS